MRPLHIFVVFVLLFTSCQDHSTDKAGQKPASDSTTEGTASSSTKTELLNEDFAGFWEKFRTAVINNDTAQIIALTEFPFLARGPSDSDPTVEYSKKEFVKVFSAYLDQYNGQDLEGNTEDYLIKKTELPKREDVQADYARIGDLVFGKSGKDWKLVFAYLNYETIDSLKK